ncbi:hypothetical protein H0H93_006525 [Arthromyces matolae]|nr:hypothetical protein H0H93_006525 [Arthromyces matolae]
MRASYLLSTILLCILVATAVPVPPPGSNTSLQPSTNSNSAQMTPEQKAHHGTLLKDYEPQIRTLSEDEKRRAFQNYSTTAMEEAKKLWPNDHGKATQMATYLETEMKGIMEKGRAGWQEHRPSLKWSIDPPGEENLEDRTKYRKMRDTLGLHDELERYISGPVISSV